MNIFVYHMLRSCGVQAGSYPKTEVKMKLIFPASKELSWLWNLGFHFPKLDYHQWLKVHIFSIWEIHTSRRIQHVVFIVKTICYLRKKLSRDLGSPGSPQLLQLQLFSQIFWNFGPSFFILSCLGVCHDSWTLFCSSLCYNLVWSDVNCFHAFRKTASCRQTH